jgi:hypothetical protein
MGKFQPISAICWQGQPLSQLELQLGFCSVLSSLRGAFLFLATSASQSNSCSQWSGCLPPPRASLTLSRLSLEPLRDFGCCREICHPPPQGLACGGGEASLQWDVALYPKGTVHHITPSVLCRAWPGSSHLTLGHHHHPQPG